jgi:hypothetical protein
MNVHQIANYDYSTDYAKLAELAKARSVICVIDNKGCDDVAKTIYSNFGDIEQWLISARGICYVFASDIAYFVKNCTSINVRFIEPPQEADF